MLSDVQVLSRIAMRGGMYQGFRTSTNRLSGQLQVSQQTVSRRLRELEAHGLLHRVLHANGMEVRLTGKGKEMLEAEYAILKSVFENPLEGLSGSVCTGEGEGAYYVKQYQEKIHTVLGFVPYPGTLNVKVSEEEGIQFLNQLPRKTIEKFRTQEREFGGIDCYPVRLESIEAGIIVPHRTRHGREVVEIVAPVYLRGHFKLKDKDPVQLREMQP